MPARPFPDPIDPTLVVATSGDAARLGLALPGGAWSESEALASGARGRDVVPAAQALLAAQALAPRALGTVLVDVGPGSFTGVRLGVTLAKTLAFATGARLLAVTSLEALAAAAPSDAPVLALVEAGRGTWYGARFEPVDADGRRAVAVAADRRPSDAWQRDAVDALWIGERLERFPAASDPEAWGARAVRSHVLGPRDVLLACVDLATAPGRAAHGLEPCYLQPSAPERARRGEP
ncbi:MAG: tRNA (adenosine(37)-N6)-threonylcarbamoyltransferase complex dimerization subunit type 1 TsaB [Planctomycetota bacterium]